MASYTIKTTRKQQVGLQFSYDHYADQVAYPTLESYLQSRVDAQVTDPMYADQQHAQAVSFDNSFQTIPELEQPVAKNEIESVITAHGGTIVPPGTPPGMPLESPPLFFVVHSPADLPLGTLVYPKETKD